MWKDRQPWNEQNAWAKNHAARGNLVGFKFATLKRSRQQIKREEKWKAQEKVRTLSPTSKDKNQDRTRHEQILWDEFFSLFSSQHSRAVFATCFNNHRSRKRKLENSEKTLGTARKFTSDKNSPMIKNTILMIRFGFGEPFQCSLL